MLKLDLPDTTADPAYWNQLYGSSLALASVQAAREHISGPAVIIVEDIAHAEALSTELGFYKHENQTIYRLPDWETLPYDVFSPHQDIISERLRTLYDLQAISPGDIVLLPVNTLLQRITPANYINKNVQIYATGQKLDTVQLRSSLDACGYTYVSEVVEHGEYTVRGSILDLFPAGSVRPYRIDLFDDEIESIRSFDPANQRSGNKYDRIEILPAREFPTDKDEIVKFRERYREHIEGDPLQSIIYKNVSNGIMPAGIEYYLPLFFDSLQTIFDYLPGGSLFIQSDSLLDIVEAFWEDLENRYEQRRHDIERPVLQPEKLFINKETVIDFLNNYARVSTSRHSGTNDQHNLPLKQPPELLLHQKTIDTPNSLEQFIKTYKGKVLFVAESAGRREVLNNALEEIHILAKYCPTWNDFLNADEKICITVSEIENGLYCQQPAICVITEQQIFGQRAAQRRRRRKYTSDADAIVRNLTDLNTGSPVVHLDYGVGRYIGLQKLTGGDYDTEFLTIEYADNDKLYVPVSSLHLISRYTGAAQENAPLHKLGSDQWQKARRRAARKAHDVAAELLDIHARRAAAKGHAYEINQDEYATFASSFPFEETPDQETAIQSVLEDLSKPQPMDRVVCGDVGFGKTEVAMRAAFIVANHGKQVAILVPTTLLAQQHYQNFSDRFADWPVSIKALTRFNSGKQEQSIVNGLENGKVDIIIGTHKLLQPGIKFRDLGLIIIDEEHRFGVRHKEKLKSLRSQVDILTLTATPIPRTLNMSLAGIRDLSIISTPPLHRHSINTFISQWNDALITEAFQRELKRGGQIYFLHNEVKTIENKTRQIQELVPEARVEFAHGQMPERQLEQVMLDFYHQRFSVLVCTTIIESGIDVPTANTIIINRADKLGLAQLHQIRGRVGRSHHRAYAYLITPPETLLTDDAKKRLDAIESLEDLGVGFTLATHDLEIRGAGELLGDTQSGQISEVGFTMYSELLEKAVQSLKDGKTPDPDMPLGAGVEVDLGIPAVIPEDYVYDIHLRLILYKRIASAETNEQLDELKVEFIDRFGLLPEPVKNLFKVTEMKLLAEKTGIHKIKANANGAKIHFTDNPLINPAKLIELIQMKPGDYRFNGVDTLNILKNIDDEDARADEITNIIHTLCHLEAA